MADQDISKGAAHKENICSKHDGLGAFSRLDVYGPGGVQIMHSLVKGELNPQVVELGDGTPVQKVQLNWTDDKGKQQQVDLTDGKFFKLETPPDGQMKPGAAQKLTMLNDKGILCETQINGDAQREVVATIMSRNKYGAIKPEPIRIVQWFEPNGTRQNLWMRDMNISVTGDRSLEPK